MKDHKGILNRLALSMLVIGILVGASASAGILVGLYSLSSSDNVISPDANLANVKIDGVTDNGVNATNSCIDKGELVNDSFKHSDFANSAIVDVNFTGDSLQYANFTNGYLV